ncbi:hypothetical protein J1N35_029544 [Gossypium stocksii]|uniref:Reverse transcriptase zinc-binding domain-containing protein n=1 Tax=Gossypium stocksii TaxID=47602 RepID=A0A9D3UZ44_9ROSI|nr:hypothetical protein J1N35_029544 [Gossypium stocksii]
MGEAKRLGKEEPTGASGNTCRPKKKAKWALGVCFNLISLYQQKQGWRIVNKPKSLVAQVLQVKYFPNESFLNLHLGNKSSYVWRSIWATKGILAKGLCWKVGTSSNISVIKDAWIHDASDFRLSSAGFITQDFKVAELINNDEWKWTRELIVYSFPDDNFLVWSSEPSGEFSENNLELLHWLTWIFAQYSPSQCRLFGCVLWAIWGDKNARIHDKVNKTDQEIANFVQSYIKELDGAKTRTPKNLKVVRKWKYPPGQVVKINFHRAFDERHFQLASGIVARNSDGFEHTPRSANGLAHILVTESLKQKVYLVESVPRYAKQQKP